MRIRPLITIGFLALLASAIPASAHPSVDHVADAASGAAHPFTGLDHLLAMISVGLLAAKLGGRSVWLLPTLFLAGMVAGGALAWSGMAKAIGGVEQGIASSVIVFGLLLVAGGRLPAWSALIAVPAFALFHGYAHLAEGVGMGGSGAIEYGLGMVATSTFLHLVGIGIGLSASRWLPVQTWRMAGGALSLVGLALLLQTL